RDAAAAMARERGAAAIADTMLPTMLAPVTQRSPDIVERVRAMMANTPVAGIVGALAAMRDREGSEPLLPTLAGLPTLVVVGEADTHTPPDQARVMAQAIPGAQLALVPRAAHLPPLEQPAETTELLRRFLDSLR
ncbi:MAG: alpha/beta hydrolase, partial [Gemmatimonadales bacterium]